MRLMASDKNAQVYIASSERLNLELRDKKKLNPEAIRKRALQCFYGVGLGASAMSSVKFVNYQLQLHANTLSLGATEGKYRGKPMVC